MRCVLPAIALAMLPALASAAACPGPTSAQGLDRQLRALIRRGDAETAMQCVLMLRSAWIAPAANFPAETLLVLADRSSHALAALRRQHVDVAVYSGEVAMLQAEYEHARRTAARGR